MEKQQRTLKIFKDPEEMNRFAAEKFMAIAKH